MKWYELSEDRKNDLLLGALGYARSRSDFELLTDIWHIYNSSLSAWYEAHDVAVNIALEREAYDRGLMGAGRRILQEFENWRSGMERPDVSEVIYIIIDEEDYPV